MTRTGEYTEKLAGASRVPAAWLLFVGAWVLFPVAFVVQVLLGGVSLPGAVALIVSIAAFIAVFVTLMVRYPFPTGDLSARELRSRLVLLAALALVAFYLEAVYGGGVPWRFMHVVVAAGTVLPIKRAVGTVVAVTVFAAAFAVARNGWADTVPDWGMFVPFLLIGVGMIAVNRLAVTVRELREAREEIARLAVSEERLRFARDLHDLLGHSLSLITLKSELAGRLLPEAPEKAAAEVHDIEGVARRSLREVREAVAGYRRPALDEELDGARQTLEAAGIEARITDDTGALPGDTDSVLAWTVREGVTNVVRHSRARNCGVELTQSGDAVRAEITDDGTGPSPEADDPGNGLSGLAERVGASGGEFEAGSLKGGGFRLRVSLPVDGRR